MTDKFNWLLDPNLAVSGPVSAAYEFLHVSVDANHRPQKVVFMNDNGFLKVPVRKFQMAEYEEWKDCNVLPPREVDRAAAALCLYL